MNYFEVFDLTPAVFLDEKELYKRFIALSKKNHPDLFAQHDLLEQGTSMEKSVEINTAYQILKDFDQRLKHILMINHIIEDQEKPLSDQQFMMQMMDFNDEIMELQMQFDKSRLQEVKTKINQQNQIEIKEAMPFIQRFDAGEISEPVLNKINMLYQRKRYLWRLAENLKQIELKSL